MMDIWRYINGGQTAFVKGDGSLEASLHHLANKVKHIGDDIQNRGLYRVTDSVALWLSESSLNGVDAPGYLYRSIAIPFGCCKGR